ncbi:MAG: hypothetical protein HUK03_06585, partial [Bacteroidaceae bacterium]|nr:hypothetical protein [Bacteroidaceae bacterium]
NMVEEFFFGYKPNPDPRPDFPIAGVELKVTPLKKGVKELLIKERLVIDLINYYTVVEESFEESMLCKKFLLMLIIFYIHEKDTPWRDMKFIYSVLWAIKDKDIEIIRQDYETIIGKIKAGLAHELSESDTYYLAACTKGQDSTELRSQPFCDIPAKSRAFSLKASYMRTILNFVRDSNSDMATNTGIVPNIKSLVTVDELKTATFEEVLTKRFEPYYGLDYKELSKALNLNLSAKDKGKYARIAKRILLKGLNNYEEADEIKKAGIIAKTIRLEANGRMCEHMSFENIDYNEIHETEDWTDSRWYEIVHSRMMLIVFRRSDSPLPEWEDEKRYVLDKIVFTSLPHDVIDEAEAFWTNIKANVENNTLHDLNDKCRKEQVNTFWRISDHHSFHVRPKAQTSKDLTESPLTGEPVSKKCYWLDNKYLTHILQLAYKEEWGKKFS